MHPTGLKKHHRHLHMAYGLSLASILGLALWYGLSSWQVVKQDATVRLQGLGGTLAGVTAGVLTHAVDGMTLLGEEFAAERGPWHPRHLLTQFLVAYPMFGGAVLINAHGRVIASLPDTRMVHAREPGPWALANGPRLVVGRPVYKASLRHWYLPLCSVMKGRAGRFLFKSYLPLSILRSQYRAAAQSIALPDVAVRLMRADGLVEVRWPRATPATGVRSGVQPHHSITRIAYSAGVPIYTFRPQTLAPRTAIEGADQHSAGAALSIVVTMPVRALWTLWWHKVWEMLALMAAIIVAGGGFYLWILKRERGTDSKQADLLSALAHQSHHDALTDILNRRGLQEIWAQIHAQAVRNEAAYSLLMLDLDHFKLINDAHGHDTGDRALIHIANILRRTLRASDWASRFGGEEFVCLLPQTGRQSATVMAERLRQEIGKAAIMVDDQTITLTVSIGLVVFPDDGTTIDDLLSRADAALYRAKIGGRDQVVPASEGTSKVFLIGRQITEAIASERIRPAFQPIIDLKSGEVVAEEALARLHLPDGTELVADEFISIADEFKTTYKIDRAIIKQVIARCVAQTRAGVPPVLHFVNVSVDLLNHPQEVEEILSFIHRGCDACGDSVHAGKPLVIEITERECVMDIPDTLRILKPFLDFGLRIALDDFGSGYSSLLYLAELPVTFLKIDMALVRRIRHDSRTQVMLRNVQALAQDLKLITIAEGVEDQVTADILRAIGVDWGQGYYFGKPAP